MSSIDRRQLALGLLAAPTFAHAQATRDRVETPIAEHLGLPWTTLQFDGRDPVPVTFDTAYLGVTMHASLAAPSAGPSYSAGGRTMTPLEGYTIGGTLRGAGDISWVAERRFEGSAVAGAIGLMVYHMVEFDWVGRRWVVGEGEPPAGAVRRRTRGDPNMLVVQADLDGIPLSLWLNPALEEGLVIRRSAAHRLGLHGRFDRLRQEVNPLDGSVSHVGQATRLSIGDVAIADPILRLHGDMEPYHVYWWRPGVDGVMGYDLLKRLNFRWSQPEETVWLAPNARMDEVRRDDRAGLGLSAHSGYVRVMDVAPGSAGETAGMEIGDEIVAFNGAASLQGLAFALTQADGVTLDLEVQRGSQTRRVPLTLRDRF